MAKTNIGIIVSVVDKASSGLKKIEYSLRGVTHRIEEASRASTRVAAGLAAVGAAGGALGYKMLKAAADMEQTQIAFETMLGSAQKANAFIKDLTDFAKRTPFEMKGLEDASKKLLAFGIDAKNVLPDLKALGDIAAGVGTEKLPFLINAFGQVRAKGRLMGQELLQFTEAGVPLAEELAKTFGKTTAEIQDMISKGQVGFEDVRKALQNLTSEGGRFNNLMDKQADSLNGMISNLQDAWDIFLRNEGKALIDWAKRFTQALIYVVQDVLPAFIGKIKAVSEWLTKHKFVLALVAGAILGALVPAVVSLTASMTALAVATIAALWPYMAIGAAIGALIYLVAKLYTHWEELSQLAIDIWGAIAEEIKSRVQAIVDGVLYAWQLVKSATMAALNFIGQLITARINFYRAVVDRALAAIKAVWSGTWQALRSIVEATLNAVASFIKSKIDWILNMVNKVMAAIARVRRAASSIGAGISSAATSAISAARGIVGLADGGIVTRPTLALIGEGGESEAVIPLSKLNSIGGGGGQIVITGNTFYGDDDAAERIAEMLADKLGLQFRGI